MSANPNQLTSQEAIETMFTYHSPTPDQLPKYQALRDKAKELALLIAEVCPPSADRTDAIRSLSNCIMTANASIARNGVGFR